MNYLRVDEHSRLRASIRSGASPSIKVVYAGVYHTLQQQMYMQFVDPFILDIN